MSDEPALNVPIDDLYFILRNLASDQRQAADRVAGLAASLRLQQEKWTAVAAAAVTLLDKTLWFMSALERDHPCTDLSEIAYDLAVALREAGVALPFDPDKKAS